MTPPTVNAYYDPTLNEIALPAGQLQPPFFGATFHPAVNFGSTGGGTIGHEMTHGFDDEGSQFDADGNLRDWWTQGDQGEVRGGDEVRQSISTRSTRRCRACKLNGKLTAGENIADIGGVKLAYEAYQAWRAQADAAAARAASRATPTTSSTSSPTRQSWCEKDDARAARDDGALQPALAADVARQRRDRRTSRASAPAFSCKAGTPMNPGKRVQRLVTRV